jgi:anthranilate synthase component 1
LEGEMEVRHTLSPSLDEFLEQAQRGEPVPLSRRIPADLETPVSAFLKLKPLGAVFLLESVEQGIQVGRYSFIGMDPYATIRLTDGIVEVEKGDESRRTPVQDVDPFSFVRKELAGPNIRLDGYLPGPIAGAVGYMSYDVVRYFERVPPHRGEGLGLPDYHFLFPRTLAVFDHVKREIEVLTLPPDGDPEAAYASARTRIESIMETLEAPLQFRGHRKPSGDPATAVFNMSEAAFKAKVLQAKEHIFAGNAFQIVLSQRLRGETCAHPFQIYRALRILNPSPYMFFVDLGDFQLIGSSPEALAKLEGGRAMLCPIAGTRPRGKTPEEDESLEEELLSDEKERAEHTMLVDLGRNDLGRVCEVGSVVTESFMQVEKYSHVMHLVSRITGKLRAEKDMFDLLRASFPAGTVTGAPKIRAMEIIGDLEEEGRGPYSGAVGYLGRQGDMDMCIAIRMLIMRGSEYWVQAGAGIVADSDPDFEYRETLNKIRALVKAVSIAEEGF